MEQDEFRKRHLDALEHDEARHNLLLGILARAGKFPRLRLWSLGAGSACALQTPPHNLLLGDLEREHCAALAEAARAGDFPGIVGPKASAERMAEAFGRIGVRFELAMPQGISKLDTKPVYPGASGCARVPGAGERDVLVEWFGAFQRETAPHEQPLTREEILQHLEGRYALLWEDGGTPVSMAIETRESKTGSVISCVYTPVELRGRGYAGSVVASLSEWIFTKGKKFVALYTDLRNPISNRVYEKIGFRRVAEASHYVRRIP